MTPPSRFDGACPIEHPPPFELDAPPPNAPGLDADDASPTAEPASSAVWTEAGGTAQVNVFGALVSSESSPVCASTPYA